jgi:hypothetical protein
VKKITLVATLALLGTAFMLSAKSVVRTNTTSYRVALLLTPENGSETFLHIVEVGRPFPPPTAKFRHLPDAAVKGVVLRDGSILVIADYEPGPDRSFGSALFRLVPGAEPVLLCDHVAFASRPLVTPDGRVFIQRGSPGPATKGGEIRVDLLSIDEIVPRTGDVKTLWRGSGYIAYTAAAFRRDIILYHIQPSGARLVLIDSDTRTEKAVLPSLPPYASDFSVSEVGNLVFQNRDENRSDLWITDRLNLVSGERERLLEDQASLAPRMWPRGEVTWNSSGGLQRAGFIDIRAFTSDGTVAAAFAFPSGSSAPDLVLLDSTGAELAQIETPERTPLTIAGFIP